jgi:hypothetical protein
MWLLTASLLLLNIINISKTLLIAIKRNPIEINHQAIFVFVLLISVNAIIAVMN